MFWLLDSVARIVTFLVAGSLVRSSGLTWTWTYTGWTYTVWTYTVWTYIGVDVHSVDVHRCSTVDDTTVE